MRTYRIVTAVAVAVASATLVALVADPAAAKGPRSATIEGPGLEAPIDGAALVENPMLTGLFGALWVDPTVPLLDEAPTGDLGPAWVITWDMGAYVDEGGNESDAPDLVRQTVYPYAAGGPVVHTEPGQPFYADETVGGWYEAPSGLTNVLGRLGVPAEDAVASGAVGVEDGRVEDGRAEMAGSTRSSAGPASDGSSTELAAGAVVLAALLVAAAVLLRIRQRIA